MQKIYVIEKNDKYLSQLFCDDINEMFTVTGRGNYQHILNVGEIYFYHNMRVAADIADKLGASWIPAIRNGDTIEIT